VEREFWKLFAGTTVSRLGDGIRFAAFPLLAASLTRDPRLVAGLTFVQGLPWLLFGLHAGAFVDRADRRAVIVAVNAARAAAAGALAAAVLLDRSGVALLYAVAFLLGTGETLVDNAAGAFLPSLVPRERLRRANGLLGAAGRVGHEFAGPPLGAVLFGLAAAAPVLADAASFAVAAAVVASVRGSFRPERAETRLWADVREGLRWLRRQPSLRAVTAAVAVLGVVDSMWFSILVLYALEVLHVGSLGYGLLLVAGGVGAVAGSLAAARAGTRAALAGAILVAAATQLVLGLTADTALAAAMLALSGASFGLWSVVATTLRQELAPDELLGRTSSVYLVLGLGGIAVGGVVGGFVADGLGIRAPFLLGAPLLALTGLWLARELGRPADPTGEAS
jgi:MFS family permease